ncbi:MAG: HicB family protein [Candidatus Harrisonbacteria bacterium CG10_big_fil_rev_8_21_14_0_10_38_8]|uniref:HicB family protein n=1 Tax=Candidatus Harrisonbacteria bacterium CG10_big_fil_rev_8_21_14_0_10_38_8 TaxID=1974582 RepID=A0A2M6WK12_9BACT|nr:MAG: HicB family protein [Candidatus Harrisonbacteria bacterium CG10_big_fil_rev_8_21_14_0_10_38_8]
MAKKKQEKIYEFETIFDPNGQGYTVTVPKLPGLVTEGENLKEAREMAKDAIECYLIMLLKEDKSKNLKTGKIKVAV